MKVIIETHKGLPKTSECFIAANGFEDLCADVIYKESYEFVKYKNLKETILVGTINTLLSYFKRSNLTQHLNLETYPSELKNFYYRNIVIKHDNSFDVNDYLGYYVKPYDNPKHFPCFQLSERNKNFLKERVEGCTALAFSAPIEPKVVTEWRCFVENRTLIDCRNYTGDFKIAPSYIEIERMIKSFSQNTYALDVYVDSNNITGVMEVNDFWAIGDYGLNPIKYAEMLYSRWKEIHQL